MFLLKKAVLENRLGAVIEVGSGSVLVSIVLSESTKKTPEIIWSKREYAVRRSDSTTAITAKAVITALMNAVLLLESEGKSVLRQRFEDATIDYLQVSMTAPWSHTITKVIGYTQEKPFLITETLVESLIEAAQKKITSELKEEEITTKHGLSILARATTDIQANDYIVTDPVGKSAQTLTLTQITAVADTYITDAIDEMYIKIMPKAVMERYSFMLMFHCITRELYLSETEYCLVDITYEATEIGIVRDGILRYCTHSPLGINTLARTISKVLNITIEEAHSFLKEPYHTHAMESLTEEKRAEVLVIFDEYQKNIAKAFTETGDKLSTPKVIFMHGGHQIEDFFSKQIYDAATLATGFLHTVHSITSEMLTQNYTPEEKKRLLTVSSDTAMLVAAQFFHKQHHCSNFIQA